MQKREIAELMRGEASYSTKTLYRLEAVLKEYPFFQAAHLLYTLNYLELKDSRFTIELRRSAMYLNDRKKMFFLANSSFFSPEKLSLLEKRRAKPADQFERIDQFLKDRADNDDMILLPDDYIQYALSEDFLPETEENGEKNILKGQNLIDDFLEKDRQNPIRIKLDETVENTDEQPVLDDGKDFLPEELFSETLANIFIKQKKYERALEIIRKINLLYPEKSSYFAPQIERLENLINTNKNI